MQCACAILSSVACAALQYFSTVSHKLQIFVEKKATLHKSCVIIFPTTLSAKFLILGRTEQDMIINVYWSSYIVPVIVRFYWNLKFLGAFSENIQITNCMKTRPVGTKVFHVHGQVDRHDEARSQIRNSANAPKSGELSFIQCSSYDTRSSKQLLLPYTVLTQWSFYSKYPVFSVR